MSCYGCSRKYGLFCKEYGCPNCGYSYCGKCLKRPIPVPRHDNRILNVCLICYDKLSKLQADEKVIDCIESLPGTIVSKATIKKTLKDSEKNLDVILGGSELLSGDDPLAELAEVLKPKSLIDTEHSNADNAEIDENLDRVISKRLQNLKVQSETTDDDIRSRLSNLTGMPQKDYSKKDLLLATDQRSDQEKMRDLLEQFAGETELDQRLETARSDSTSDIERRLLALRGDSSEHASNSGAIPKMAFSPDTNTPSDNEQDEETMLKDIMQKYLAEARLPPAPTNEENELMSSIPKPPEGTRSSDLEELPWCNICNEDAVFRCKGCDGELFCAQCFRECHDDDEEYRAHTKVAYSAPPKFKENHF